MPVLTERYINALAKEPAPAGVVLYVDEHRDAPSGFCLRRTPSGAMAYVLRYRVKGAHLERKITVSAVEDMTLAEARDEAADMRAEARRGNDPMADREKRGAQAKADHEAATVEAMMQRFEDEHVSGLRPATRKCYHTDIKCYINPALGKLKAKDVTKGDVKRMLAGISGAGSKARAHRVLSSAYNLAIADEWGVADRNPCSNMKLPKVQRRKRRLDKQEFARFKAALDALESDPSCAQTVKLCRVLLLTGARGGETREAKWADIDLERAEWTKPGATTKTGETHTVPLSPEAVEAFKAIPRTGSEYVFPRRDDPRRHMPEPRLQWARITEKAELPGLRPHDLRRSFISAVVSAGLSLETASALAGHTRAETTRGYLYMLDDALRDGAAAVGKLYGAGR